MNEIPYDSEEYQYNLTGVGIILESLSPNEGGYSVKIVITKGGLHYGSAQSEDIFNSLPKRTQDNILGIFQRYPGARVIINKDLIPLVVRALPELFV